MHRLIADGRIEGLKVARIKENEFSNGKIYTKSLQYCLPLDGGFTHMRDMVKCRGTASTLPSGSAPSAQQLQLGIELRKVNANGANRCN